jgi:hypothetical protein
MTPANKTELADRTNVFWHALAFSNVLRYIVVSKCFEIDATLVAD